MTNQDALRICIVASVLALAAAALSGCGPPPPPNGIDVGPLVLDPEPPELDRPLGPMDRLGQLQARCWSIRLDWHHLDGWTVTTKADAGGIASEVRRVDAPTLDAALREVAR